MLVRDVMATQVVSVTPETRVKRAIGLLHTHQITAMPVVDADGELVGVVSEADLIRGAMLPDRRAHEIPVRVDARALAPVVGDVMTPSPVTVRSDQDLADAGELLGDTQVKSLPVVDGHRLVGMLSRRDLIAVLARPDSVIESDVVELLRDGDLECVVDVLDGVVLIGGPTESHARDIARVLAASVPGVVAVELRD